MQTKRRSQWPKLTMVIAFFFVSTLLFNVYMISDPYGSNDELMMDQLLYSHKLLNNTKMFPKSQAVKSELLNNEKESSNLNNPNMFHDEENMLESEMGGSNHSQIISNTTLSNKEALVTIAYAVSLTACGDFYPEGAAILKHSIHLNSYPLSGSKYAYKMYLFAHPSTADCLEPYEKLGYNVLMKETPINASKIEGDFLREKVVKTGCCGEKEFIKLYAYTLTDHPIVVHLDLDSLIMQPLDDLFDVMLGEGDRGSALPVMGKPLPEKIDAFFTRDYNMVNVGKKNVGIQGGFLVVKPNLDYFEEYKKIILKGDFVEMKGWAGKYGGYFGAQQIQGICAYFYDGLHPGTAVELDRCIYNSMVDDPYQKGRCRDNRQECDDCRKTDVSLIKSVHFTLCGKPWVCPTYKIREPNCKAFHFKWFSVRKDLEEKMGVPGVNTGKHLIDAFLGYCTGGGERNYIPLTKFGEV